MSLLLATGLELTACTSMLPRIPSSFHGDGRSQGMAPEKVSDQETY